MQTQTITNPEVAHRIRTQCVEDLQRLARKAEAEGVTILLTQDGAHFATSRSNRTLLHRVSRRGCDCRGYRLWGRCGHHSLLLAELGMLPDIDPEPPTTMTVVHIPTCPLCKGRGYHEVCDDERYAGAHSHCSYCFGTGAAESPKRVAA